MKKIWIVYPYGAIAGERFLEARHIRFGKMLAQNGYKVIFWTANFSHTFKKARSKGWKKIRVCDNFDVILVPTRPYKGNISIGRVLFEIGFSRHLFSAFKKSKKPDLILTAGTGLVTAFYPIWPYVKNNPIPVIYDIMDIHLFNSYMEKNHKLFVPMAKMLTKNIEWREKNFYKHVSAVCGLGRNQLEIAKQRVGKEEIPSCLVYNGIIVDDFRNKMQESNSEIVLPEKKEGWIWCVYAGSLGPSYDVGTILKCAETVKQNDDHIQFIIAGAGPQQEDVRNASKDNNRIIYIGAVKPENLPYIYSQCDVGLCTYTSYSTVDMPDKFYDYTAAGLAVVNSLQGELKEYVVDAGAGVQYQAEDSASLYESIKSVIENLENYKNASYALAYRFDLNNQMKPLLQMINGLVE